MGSSKSNTSNTRSAFSGISHHGTSSAASLAKPSSAASIPYHTRQSNIYPFPSINNSSAQQQMLTPPNSNSNCSNKAQSPIRFHWPYPNVFPQNSITKANMVPNPSLSQNLNLFAQQPTPTVGSDSVIQNGQQLSERVVSQQTHIGNETGQFVDERSWSTCRQFPTRHSEVNPELGSWPSNDASQENMDDEDVIIQQHLMDSFGKKNKERLYGTRQLDAQYTPGRGSLKHQLSTSNSVDQDYDELRQQLQDREQAYDDLKQQFENLQNLVNCTTYGQSTSVHFTTIPATSPTISRSRSR